jgi:hypothetical protein
MSHDPQAQPDGQQRDGDQGERVITTFATAENASRAACAHRDRPARDSDSGRHPPDLASPFGTVFFRMVR